MDITEGLRPAIVAILAGEGVIGTGFFVTSDGYVLTCYHVIEPLLAGGNEEITIRTRTGDKIKATYEKNKSGPEGHIDFAVLKTLNKGPFPCLPLSRDCNVGDRWCSRGFSFPRTYEDARNEGTVFDKPERPQGGYDIKLSSDLPVRGGSSGSPLLDYRTGSVFGIMKSRPTEEGWSEGFAVPIEDVLARWPQLERLNSESETLILVRPPPRGIINVPDLPPSFLARPDVLMAVKEVLLADSGQATAITGTRSRVGLHGMGGIGKSVLAAAIARDADVQARFHDGIFWLNVGTDPRITSLQASLAEMLDSPRAFENAEAGRIYLSKQLANKACLIILDDVWNAEDVRALFSSLGRNCRILITTRDSGIITALGAREYRLDLMTAEESLELLALWAEKDVSDLPDEAAQIVQECGRLPLALTLCGALARDEVPWNDLLGALKDASLEFLDHPQGSVMRSMKVSVERLTPEERDCYLKLAVFPPDEAVPEATILTLWCYEARLKERDARRIISALSRKALLKRSETAGRSVIELHDLQHDYLRNVRSDLQALHRLILDAYKNKTSQGRWHTGPDDGYFFQHLAYHLCHAGRHDCLKALLIDFEWMQARIRSTDVTGLIHDYDFVSSRDEIRDVQGAIRLSAHVLLSDPGQLPSQLMGRLKDHDSQKVQSLLGQIPGKVLGPWIRPLSQSLTPPGGPLIQTLEGHADWVNAVAVTPDGSRAISGSDDRTLKVWDLESGRAVQTLEGHASGVSAVAVTPDGSRAISGSDDRTLKVWELESGRAVQTLEGHASPVSAVAVTPDGSRAISGSYDGTLKVWDLESGRVMAEFTGESAIHSVVLSDDGRKAVAGEATGRVHFLRLENFDARGA